MHVPPTHTSWWMCLHRRLEPGKTPGARALPRAHVPAKLEAGESRHPGLLPSLQPVSLWSRCPQHGQQAGTSLPLPEAQTARPDQRPLTAQAASKTCPEHLLCVRPTSVASSAKNCPAPNTLRMRWALLSASEEALSPSRLPTAPGSHQLPVAAGEAASARQAGSGQARSPMA